MKKRKIVERLYENEALVVAPVAFWEHVIFIYENLAEDRYEKEWKEAAEYIKLWVHNTSYVPEDDYE